jgi:hypothetical protein
VSPEGDIKNVSCRPPWRVYVEGRQVGIEIIFKRWSMIGGASLVRHGIMPKYTDWSGAMRYFQKRKRYCE